MTHFETFLVPVDHFQLLTKSFDVAINIRYLYLGASDNQTTCQVQRLLVSLLNQLVVPVEGV